MDRSTPNVLRVSDIVPVPWRNGGGLTRELLAQSDPQDWLLRVSVADIHASGPFSVYPA
jgi:environmental stress-induced protein Ves